MVKVKKAQTTLFIIVGIVIAMASIAVFYVQRAEVEEPLEKETPKPEFAGQNELKIFVDSCLKDIVLEGLEIIRLQGGFIEIPKNLEKLNVRDDENRLVSTIDERKKVILRPDAVNELPYWLTSASMSIPRLSYIEKQLENYIEKELNLCVNDFNDFRDQGFQVEFKDIDAQVSMEKAVVANVNFPITLRKGDILFDEKNFVYSVPIDMKLVQKVASQLALLEDFHTYLEDNTKNLISLYSGVDEKKLPPFYKTVTNLDCKSTNWQKADVKTNLKNILNFNMQNLKVAGTSYTLPQAKDQQFQAVYESFVYELFQQEFPNLEIEFIYDTEWEFLEFDVNPSSGNTLRPEKVVSPQSFLLPMLCVYKYPFKYTVQYPVLVRITDKESAKIDPETNAYFEREGFTFQFPMVAYLCGNQNRECKRSVIPAFDITAFASADLELLPETLFCDEEQKISKDITIKTFDAVTSQALADADVNYFCGSYQNDCFVGRTNEEGILKTKFPLCINGQIYFNKKGYSNLRQPLTVYEEEEKKLAYFLNPLNSMGVDVKKIEIRSYVKNFFENGDLKTTGSLNNLAPGENVNIVSDDGLFYIYPDPENRTFSLTSGIQNFNLQLVAAENKYAGSLNIGTFISKQDSTKNKVTFYIFEDTPNDPVLTDEGDLEAELLYACEKNIDACNFGKCSFSDMSGRNIHDFNDNLETCEKAHNVTITKEQYEEFVKPTFQ